MNIHSSHSLRITVYPRNACEHLLNIGIPETFLVFLWHALLRRKNRVVDARRQSISFYKQAILKIHDTFVEIRAERRSLYVNFSRMNKSCRLRHTAGAVSYCYCSQLSCGVYILNTWTVLNAWLTFFCKYFGRLWVDITVEVNSIILVLINCFKCPYFNTFLDNYLS